MRKLLFLFGVLFVIGFVGARMIDYAGDVVSYDREVSGAGCVERYEQAYPGWNRSDVRYFCGKETKR